MAQRGAPQRQDSLDHGEDQRQDQGVVADLGNHCITVALEDAAALDVARAGLPAARGVTALAASRSAFASSGGMYFSSCFASSSSATKMPPGPRRPRATTPWPSRNRSGTIPA